MDLAFDVYVLPQGFFECCELIVHVVHVCEKKVFMCTMFLDWILIVPDIGVRMSGDNGWCE